MLGLRLIGALSVLLFSVFGWAQNPINFMGSYMSMPLQRDITKPVSTRSHFLLNVEPNLNGADLTVDLYDGSLNDVVTLVLQVALNDGAGNVIPVTFKSLSDKVADNPTTFHSRRQFHLTYTELNADLAKVLPPQLQHLQIGPGSALFVMGYWHGYNHMWGSVERAGLFYMPGAVSQMLTLTAAGSKPRRAEQLDLAYPITNMMAMRYNQTDTSGQVTGLKEKGQIRSRLEAEGKFQVPLEQLANLRKAMFALAEDAVFSTLILGPDWTIEPEMRYMRKDAMGAYILDAQNLPTPDPMVDTYYDSVDSKGAQKDIAIRYRWTEGNQTGSWNFKPGAVRYTTEGLVFRVEYGVDTTDDKPETIAKFADSLDPINPFLVLREYEPTLKPSDFLQKSIKITDTRHKFKLKHKNGLVIEVSVDDVLGTSLRNGREVRFAQFEADVDHMSTVSANTATTLTSNGNSSVYLKWLNLDQETKTKMSAMTNSAFLDGKPVIHTVEDLKADSPVCKTHEGDIALALQAIVALRDYTLGDKWLPAPQKASLAAYLLGHVDKMGASPSVRRMAKAMKANGVSADRIYETVPAPVPAPTAPLACTQAL